MHSAVRRQDAAQRRQADIRIVQVVQHAGADDLVEHPAQLPHLFDRQAMKVEISQAVFALQLPRMAEAQLTDVAGGDMRGRFPQRMDCSLRRPTTCDQNLAIAAWLLYRPQQQRPCPAALRVAIELNVPIEITQRGWVGMLLVERPYRVVSGRSSLLSFPR